MIIEEIRNIKSGRKELRQFGLTVGTALGLIGSLLFIRQKENYPIFLGTSLTFILFGLALPQLLKAVYRIWMSLAILIGWLATRLILLILFYFVLTPISLLARVFGKYFLNLKFEPTAHSYWITKDQNKCEPRSYENQY